MPFNARSVFGVLAVAAVALSCVPVLGGAGSSQQAGPPTTQPVAGQGPQVAMPPGGPAPSAVGGATNPAAVSDTIRIVVPAGAVAKLQKSLRAQAAVPPSDFSAADLAKLVIQLDGRTLSPSDYTITKAEYDDQQGLVLTIVFTNPPAKPVPVRVATADGVVTLLGETAANGEPARIDVHSTARALMNQLLRRPESEADRQAYEDVIAQFQYNLITSSQPRHLDRDLDMTGLLQRIGTQIASGTPLTPEALRLITSPPSTGGGGGGCGFAVTQSGSGSGEPTGSGSGEPTGSGSGTPTGSGSGTPTGSGSTAGC